MSRVSGRNSMLKILDSTSASRNISGRSNSATLSLTSEEMDVTCFGATHRERTTDGLKDWSLEISGFFDGAACQIDEWLQGIQAACTSVCFAPGGSTAGLPYYSGCAILQDYSVESAVDGPVSFTATFQAASTLNRTTIA